VLQQRPQPLQNRVTPEGDIIACAARGTVFGNRGGRIHGADRRLTSKRWHSKQWICCVLEFKGRRRQVMAPNRYTELFFLDEATALSAGHRPCFECRREAAVQFATLWNKTKNLPGRAAAGEMDEQLQRERVGRAGNKLTWTARWPDLPDATFVRWQPTAISPTASTPTTSIKAVGMLCGKWFHPWTPAGYGLPVTIPSAAELEVLTPKSIVTVLGAGYAPVLHSSLKVG
jgi:hypothetical protein